MAHIRSGRTIFDANLPPQIANCKKTAINSGFADDILHPGDCKSRAAVTLLLLGNDAAGLCKVTLGAFFSPTRCNPVREMA
jgi:hypothetical protein